MAQKKKQYKRTLRPEAIANMKKIQPAGAGMKRFGGEVAKKLISKFAPKVSTAITSTEKRLRGYEKEALKDAAKRAAKKRNIKRQTRRSIRRGGKI